jgi:hypothetical protein
MERIRVPFVVSRMSFSTLLTSTYSFVRQVEMALIGGGSSTAML